MNNFGGEKSVLMDEIARRQRKLIPLNIVVAIIALVAAVSLLFAPIVSVDAVGLGDYITEMMGEQSSGGDSSEEGPTIDTAKIVSTVTSNMGNVSLTTMSLATLAFSDDLTETLKDYVSEIGSETLKKSEKELITDVAVPMMVEMMEEESGEEAPDNIKNMDADAIYDKAKALETASAGEVDETISALAEELQNQLGEDYISDENLADLESSIRTVYDDTVAATDGTFTIESCICVFASKSLQESGEITQTFTSYADLIDYFMDSSSELDDTIAQVEPILKIVAIAILFFTAVWLILFLFAFLHLFAKNKRFTMWYVKLFGFLPCLIFGVAPLVAGAIVPGMEGGAEIAGILGMISTMTWISGACYILLWIISIFWAFPIKRKIRAYNKQLKAM
ncbi:MAG TPA: hypothetical protein IAC90_02150 [Candidatus Coproplasma stercorigallinarum]|nr:hypothetical protein [Candidatus Coproplasma stercorigallinarum]